MILLTGGAGYIGSHTAISLLSQGYDVFILDNLSNSSLDAIKSIENISGKKVIFKEMDLRNRSEMRTVFESNTFEGVIHFAAYKAVGESVEKPLKYYDNNLNGLVSLLNFCEEYQISNFIFSSSCTVYGSPDSVPVGEDESIKDADSPYGTTKIICENILNDFSRSNSWFKHLNLRYFNPIGAHQSGLIGDDPEGIPNNLLPYVVRVAAGVLPKLKVFGKDYNTEDGTAIRDYIHVCDLAEAHVRALEVLLSNGYNENIKSINIGTGEGVSVLQLIRTFEQATGQKVEFEFTDRRKGDVEKIYAKSDLSKEILSWETKYSLEEMLSSAWNYQKKKINA